MAHFGVLNVNKPAGITSRHVVDRVERLVRPAKAGHAGTLDPLAAGVLVICVGQATRLIRFVQQMRKYYRATFLLGHRSETDDVEGEVTAIDGAVEPTRAMLSAVLPRFIGQIQQRPPAHSAIKIAGRRAYKLARKGTEFELADRPVTIHELVVRRFEYPRLELDIECGSGTYVRALGRDIAAALGTSAVMSALVRTAIGRFHVENAIALGDLTPETLLQRLQPAITAAADVPRVDLSEEQHHEVRNGLPIPLHSDWERPSIAAKDTEWAAVNAAGELVSILREKHPGELWPATNFGPPAARVTSPIQPALRLESV